MTQPIEIRRERLLYRYERLETLFDYAPAAGSSFDYQADEVLAHRPRRNR